MDDYLEMIDGVLKKKYQQYHEQYQELNIEITEDDYHEHLISSAMESVFDEWLLHEESLTRFYSSFVVMWYSHVEQLFYDFCYERSVLRRAQAFAILARRGHPIPTYAQLPQVA